MIKTSANIVELMQNNLFSSLGASAQLTYTWKQVTPNAKLNRSLKKWTEAESLAEAEAAAGSGGKAVTAATGSGKQSKRAKGSSSAAAAPATTAKSKAAAAPAARPSQGQGQQKGKKPPLPPPVDPPLEVGSSEDEAAEEEEEEEPKVHDMVVDPSYDVSQERDRSLSASASTRLPLSHRTGVRLELRPNPRHSSGSNQEVKPDTPCRKWRASSKPEEASGSPQKATLSWWRKCQEERPICGLQGGSQEMGSYGRQKGD